MPSQVSIGQVQGSRSSDFVVLIFAPSAGVLEAIDREGLAGSEARFRGRCQRYRATTSSTTPTWHTLRRHAFPDHALARRDRAAYHLPDASSRCRLRVRLQRLLAANVVESRQGAWWAKLPLY
jgi:hypothetical protein